MTKILGAISTLERMVLNGQDVGGSVLRYGSFLNERPAHRVRVEDFLDRAGNQR